MIGIQVNGIFLDMGDVTVRIEKINAMFVADIYQGDYSFPFTVPATDHNIRTLGFVNVIESNNKLVQFDADLYLFGLFYASTKLIINAATKRSISFNLAGGIKGLQTAETLLQEIDLGPDYALGYSAAMIATAATTISKIGDWTKYGFTFVPHWNPDFYGTTNPTFQGTVNCVDCSTGNIRYNDPIVGNKYAIVPFLFLFYVLSRIFKAEALTPMGTFWDDAEAQKMLLYNNHALDTPNSANSSYLLSDQITYHNQTSRVQFKKGPLGSFDNFTTWSNTAFEFTVTPNFYGPCTLDLDMSVYISNNLGYDGVYFCPEFAIRTTAGILDTIFLPIEPGTTQHVSHSLAINFNSANLGQKVWVEYLHNQAGVQNPYPYPVVSVAPGASMLLANLSSPLNTYSSLVKFKDHVNAMTVSELLAEVKKIGVDLIFNFTDRTVTLNKIAEYLKYPLADDYTSKASKDFELSYDTKDQGFTFIHDFSGDDYAKDNFKSLSHLNFKGEYTRLKDLPAAAKDGDYVYVKSLNQYFIVQSSAWIFYSDNYYPVKVGEGAVEIKSKLAPLFMGIHDNDGGANSDENNALMPHIKQKGSSDMFGLGINDFNLRICFYRGLNQFNALASPQGRTYILASSTKYGINGDQTGDYDLAPSRDDSFYAKVLKPWLNVLNNGEIVERDILLNQSDILSIGPTKPIIVDSTGFFIKSISLNISKQLQMSRFKLLKMLN